MGYKFRLQKILDVKEKEEDNKKNELGIINSKISIAVKELEDLEKELSQNEVERKQKNIEGASIKEILELNAYGDYIKNMIQRKKDEIRNLEIAAHKKKDEYIESRKERKSFENLKDKDYDRFLKKEAKEEEKVIDEIVSFSSNKN